MRIVSILGIGKPGKSRPKGFPNRGESDPSRSRGVGPSWHPQHAVIRKEAHDAIKIMGIERIQHCFQSGNRGAGSVMAASRRKRLSSVAMTVEFRSLER